MGQRLGGFLTAITLEDWPSLRNGTTDFTAFRCDATSNENPEINSKCEYCKASTWIPWNSCRYRESLDGKRIGAGRCNHDDLWRKARRSEKILSNWVVYSAEVE